MESSPMADSKEVGHPFALDPYLSTTLTFIVVVLFFLNINLPVLPDDCSIDD